MSLYTDIYCKYKVGDLVSVINSPPIERGRVGVVKEITCKSYAISNTVKFFLHLHFLSGKQPSYPIFEEGEV